MGAVILLTPVVIAAWPAFAAAVASAATTLGYAQVGALLGKAAEAKATGGVQIQLANSEVVTDQLGRDQKITIVRDGVTIVFKRDERGKATLTASGEGHSHEDLRALGEELSGRVVQQYVYRQILGEVAARNYNIVEESVDANHAIRVTVRHWEN
jgi:hypothetical protein